VSAANGTLIAATPQPVEVVQVSAITAKQALVAGNG